MSRITGRFLHGPIMGHVVRMTLTGALGVGFMFLIDAANLFWISTLGVERLVAALGFAWMIQFFAVSIGIGMMVAATATVSRLIGQHDIAGARRQTSVNAAIAVLAQAVVAAGIFVFRHELLALAGASGDTAREAARYLAIAVPTLPVMALGMMGSAVLRAEGDAWRAMSVTLTSGLVTMIIDPLLIVVLGLGLEGAAISVIFARFFSAGLSVWYVLRVHDLAGRIGWRDVALRARPFGVIAIPAMLTQLSTPFGNALVTGLMAQYGDGAVAGWAVVTRMTVLAFGGIFALSSAISGIFGQNYGGGALERVRLTYVDALRFSAIYVSLAWAFLALASAPAIAVFSMGDEAAQVLRAFTMVAAGGWFFAGGLFVANAAFNALGRPVFSTMFNWLRDGVLLWPLAAVLGARFGAPGVVYGQALAAVVAGSLAVAAGWRHVTRLQRWQDRG